MPFRLSWPPILFLCVDGEYGKVLGISVLVWAQPLAVSSVAGLTIPGDGEKHF